MPAAPSPPPTSPTSSPTPAGRVTTPSPRHIERNLALALLEVGVVVDPERTTVRRDGDRYDVVATVEPPEGGVSSDDGGFECDMLCSAVHTVILEDMVECYGVPTEKLSVQVYMLPPAPSSSPPPAPAVDAAAAPPAPAKALATVRPTRYIQAQCHTLFTESRNATHAVVLSCYEYVVEKLPWRGRAAMRAQVTLLTERFLLELGAGHNTRKNGHFVDDILPPVSVFLTLFDQNVVREEVHAHLGRAPVSLLEFYEVVLGKAFRGVCRKWQTARLAAAVFHVPERPAPAT